MQNQGTLRIETSESVTIRLFVDDALYSEIQLEPGDGYDLLELHNLAIIDINLKRKVVIVQEVSRKS